MYRYLRRLATHVASTSGVRNVQGSKAATEVNFSTVSRRTGRSESEITYCRLQYLKKIANAKESASSREKFKANSTHRAALFSTHSQAMEKVSTVKDIFEQYHTIMENGNFKPESFVDFTSALSSAVYSDLAWLPWLHSENQAISYMQILMNGRTSDLLTEPLYSYSQFQDLCNHIHQSVAQIPGKDCPSILMSLIYSGMDQKDPLAIELLWKCYDAIPDLEIKQLRDCTHVLQTLGNRDYKFAEKLVSRLDVLLRDDPQNVQFEIRDLCVSNPVLATYMSQDLLERCAAALLSKMQEKGTDIDISSIGYCLRYARKMSFNISREKIVKVKVMARAALDHGQDFDNLQSHQVAEICHNAARLNCYSGDLVEKMQAHSLKLLRDKNCTLHIRDITNLLFAFRKDSSPAIKKELTQLMIKHMDDADVLTLSNIADNMLELNLQDPELLSSFQNAVLQNIENISQFITRLVKVLRLLRDRLEHDNAFNQQVSEILLRVLNRRQGYDPTFVVVVAQFVLPTIRVMVPAILLDCLLNVIPRCSLSLTLLVLNGLEKMKRPWSRPLHSQVLEIQSHVQQNVEKQLENIAYAGQLAQLIKGVHIDSQNRDFVLLDRMMDYYPRLTKSMSCRDFLKTVQTFKRFSHPYYTPEVFEDLIAFAKGNYSQIHFAGIMDLVNVLASTAYRPEDFEAFVSFVLKVLESNMEENNPIGQISMACYLSLMQVFEDNILGQIFTFDYLEELDRIMETEPRREQFLKHLTMHLNRSVVLECPHLDIPWFHEDYCQRQAQALKTKGFLRNFAFVGEVEAALQEVLIGQNFGQNMQSPYFHPIDFEIILDPEGKPVNPETVTSDEKGYQRLAVMLIANRQLCANSHRRRGRYLQDKRHLEILGYRVIEIPRYDWNSMALSDWAAKVNFVHDKIFKTSSKEEITSLADSGTTMHPYWK